MPILRRALFVVTSSLLHQVWHTDVLGYSRGIFSCTTPYSPIGSGECGTWNRRFAGKYALSGREHIDCVGLASHVSSRRVRNGHTLHAGSHSRLRILSSDRGYVISRRLPQIPSGGSNVMVLLGQRSNVSSRIVARAVAAEATRRNCFSRQNPPLTSAATILELTLDNGGNHLVS